MSKDDVTTAEGTVEVVVEIPPGVTAETVRTMARAMAPRDGTAQVAAEDDAATPGTAARTMRLRVPLASFAPLCVTDWLRDLQAACEGGGVRGFAGRPGAKPATPWYVSAPLGVMAQRALGLDPTGANEASGAGCAETAWIKVGVACADLPAGCVRADSLHDAWLDFLRCIAGPDEQSGLPDTIVPQPVTAAITCGPPGARTDDGTGSDWRVTSLRIAQPDSVMCLALLVSERPMLQLWAREKVLGLQDLENIAQCFGRYLPQHVRASAAHAPGKPGLGLGAAARLTAPARPGPAPDFSEHVGRMVRLTPQAPAIEMPDLTLSYAALWDVKKAIEGALRQAELAPGERAAIVLPRHADLIASLLACWDLGVVFSILECTWPDARLRGAVSRLDPKAVITIARMEHLVPNSARAIFPDGLPSEPAIAQRAPPVLADTADAYVCFTSGSTGAPKGAILTRRGLKNYLEWARETFAPEGRATTALYSSPAVDFSITAMLVPLTVGSCVVIPAEDGVAGMTDLLGSGHRFDLLKLTPTGLRVLIGALGERVIRDAADVFVLGGEMLPGDLRAVLANWHDRRVFDEYGPTETVVGSVACAVEPGGGTSPGYIGTPVFRTGVEIHAPGGEGLPPGFWGEIVLTGDGVGRGYLGDDAAERNAFLPSPSGAGLPCAYKTGDLGRITTRGAVELRGRIDDQIKHHGYRLEPRELTNLAETAEGVGQAVALQVAGTHGPCLALFVTAKGLPPSKTDWAKSVRDHLALHLPAHALPNLVIPLQTVPIAPSGKMDLAALKAIAANAGSSLGADAARAVALPEPPGSDSDPAAGADLYDVWREVLAVEDFGSGADFFRLGGDSVRALMIVAQMRARGWRLEFNDFLRTPRFADIAEKAVRINALPPTRQASDLSAGKIALTPNQMAMKRVLSGFPKDWIMLWQGHTPPNVPAGALRRAYHQVLNACPVLTRAPGSDVCSDTSFFFVATGADQERQALAKARDWIDPDTGCLSALVATPNADNGFALHWVIHHVVADLASWTLLTSSLRQILLGHAPVSLDDQGGAPATGAPPWNWQATAPDFGPARRWTPPHPVRNEILETIELRHLNMLLQVAVGRAICQTTGRSQVLVCGETHGRSGDLDPSGARFATVGWHTAYQFHETRHPNGETLLAAMARLAPSPGISHHHTAHTEPKVAVNLAGQMQSGDAFGTIEFHPHPDDAVPLRIFPLQINFRRDGSGITGDWVYGTDRFTAESLAEIFALFCDELTGLTLADIPAAARAGQAPPHVLAYALGSLVHPAPCHLEQVAIDLHGGLTARDVRTLFSTLMARHDALRTVIDLDATPPRSRVLNDVPVPLTAITASDTEDLDAGARRIRRDHLKDGLNKDALPFRLAYITAPGPRGRLIWTHHHGAFDGLSQLQLVKELLGLAEARQLPAAAQPASYFTWTQRRGNPWRQPAGGHSNPNGHSRFDTANAGFGTRTLARGTKLGADLKRFAAEFGVPPSAVAFLAWSDAAESMGLADAARPAGIMLAGRDPDYPGSERLVGALSFTVGVPAALSRNASGLERARRMALRLGALMESETAYEIGCPPGPAVLSVVSAPQTLRSATNAFGATILWESATGGFSPFRVTATVMLGDGCVIRLSYHKAILGDREARMLLARYLRNLRRFLRDPNAPNAAVAPPVLQVSGPGRQAPGDSVDKVARAFSRVLGTPVSPDDDFFDIGGHSLAALKLVSELRTTFGRTVKLTELIARRTPLSLAGLLVGETRAAQAGQGDLAAQTGSFPLTPLQQAYLVGGDTAFELGGVDAHLYAEFDFADLDHARAEQALRALIMRHDMLRASVVDLETQQVAAGMPFSVERVDLTHVGSEVAKTALERLRAERAHRRRAHDAPPLFSLTVAEMPCGMPARVMVSVSLIIGDAKSWFILASEFTALYEGKDLPDAPKKHFSEFAQMQSARRRAPVSQEWRARIDSMPEPPQLARRVSPTQDGAKGAASAEPRFVRRSWQLDRRQSRTLAERARDLHVTQSTLLAAVYCEVLAHFAEARPHLLNFTLYDRPDGFERVVGDFTAPLLVANPMSGADFAARVKDLQDSVWQALDHREVNGIDVLNEIGRKKRARFAALAPVVFTSTIDIGDGDAAKVMPAGCRFVWSIGQTPQVALDYQVHRHDGIVHINWDSVDSAFADGLIDAMFDAHRQALERLTSAAGTAWRRSVLPVQTPPRAEPAAGKPRVLHQSFLDHAKRHPDATAVICSDRTLTYAALERESRVLAHGLAARGLVAAGDGSSPRVAILLDKGWTQCVAALGILRCGAAFVPLDTDWPDARISDTLAQTGGPVLCDTSTMTRLGPRAQAIPIEDLLDAPEPEDPLPPESLNISPRDLAYVIFTSGSTGQPKGVMISHAAAANTVDDINARFGIGRKDCIFGLSALCFDLSVYDLFGSLSAGACLSLPDQHGLREPRDWLDQMARDRVTVWNSVPVLMELACEAADRRQTPGAMQHLRLALLSGDWVPPTIDAKIRAHAPDSRVVALGGATEAAIWSILHEMTPGDRARHCVPYGRAMAGQWVAVCDPKLHPKPMHAVGEIVIGGAGVAMGYLGDAAKTDAQFPAHPDTGERVYRTGDYGRQMENGEIEFLGRRDFQVKIAGNRIEIGEIQALASGIAGMDAFYVVPVGERDKKRLAGFFKGDIDATALRRELGRRLPASALPSDLIRLEDFPLNSNGKVDRAELIAMATEHPDAQTARHPPAPSTDLIARLQDILAPFVAGDAPNATSDLLSLGMSSIDILRFLNAVEREFAHRLTFARFMEAPRLDAIAAVMRNAQVDRPDGANTAPVSAPARPGWHNPVPAAKQERCAREDEGASPKHLLRHVPSYSDDLTERRSTRRFLDAPVPLDRITTLLSCLREVSREGQTAHFYPSAGSCYAIDTFIEVRKGRVEGLNAGLYLYDAKAHDLVSSTLGVEIHPDAHRGQSNTALIQDAAFALYLVTKPIRTVSIYGEDAEPLALLNAGYMGALIARSAQRCGIGICAAHGMNFEAVRHLFLDGGAYELVHFMFGGLREDDTSSGGGRERIVL